MKLVFRSRYKISDLEEEIFPVIKQVVQQYFARASYLNSVTIYLNFEDEQMEPIELVAERPDGSSAPFDELHYWPAEPIKKQRKNRKRPPV